MRRFDPEELSRADLAPSWVPRAVHAGQYLAALAYISCCPLTTFRGEWHAVPMIKAPDALVIALARGGRECVSGAIGVGVPVFRDDKRQTLAVWPHSGVRS